MMSNTKKKVIEVTNLFNFDETNDLPKQVVAQLNVVKRLRAVDFVLSLFEIKEELSLDEIIVGLFRKHKLEKSRIWITQVCWRLKKKRLIEKDALKNTYYLIKECKNDR